jgi:hypothetical protein
MHIPLYTLFRTRGVIGLASVAIAGATIAAPAPALASSMGHTHTASVSLGSIAIPGAAMTAPGPAFAFSAGHTDAATVTMAYCVNSNIMMDDICPWITHV